LPQLKANQCRQLKVSGTPTIREEINSLPGTTVRPSNGNPRIAILKRILLRLVDYGTSAFFNQVIYCGAGRYIEKIAIARDRQRGRGRRFFFISD